MRSLNKALSSITTMESDVDLVRGLVRSGALKESEKPLWYDVYAACPPCVEPSYERSEPSEEVPNIVYKEDLVRAKFYKTYGNPDVIDMKDHSASTSQRFIDKYFEVRKRGAPEDKTIFEAAEDALRSEGFKLKSLEEISKEKQAAVARRIEEMQSKASQIPEVKDASRSAGVESADAEDTLDEEIAHPNYDKILNKNKPTE